jgi:hypothetical protein
MSTPQSEPKWVILKLAEERTVKLWKFYFEYIWDSQRCMYIPQRRSKPLIVLVTDESIEN